METKEPEDKPQHYVKNLQKKEGRLAVTFQFTPSIEATWWQCRKENDSGTTQCGTEEDWIEDIANEYEGCAARLVGEFRPGLPTIEMGELNISVSPNFSSAMVIVEYYKIGASRKEKIPEAEYRFILPASQLAAAFKEAAEQVRRLLKPSSSV